MRPMLALAAVGLALAGATAPAVAKDRVVVGMQAEPPVLDPTINAAAAIDAARRRPGLRIQPTLGQRADGKRIPVLPPEAGYPALSDTLMDQVAR